MTFLLESVKMLHLLCFDTYEVAVAIRAFAWKTIVIITSYLTLFTHTRTLN